MAMKTVERNVSAASSTPEAAVDVPRLDLFARFAHIAFFCLCVFALLQIWQAISPGTIGYALLAEWFSFSGQGTGSAAAMPMQRMLATSLLVAAGSIGLALALIAGLIAVKASVGGNYRAALAIVTATTACVALCVVPFVSATPFGQIWPVTLLPAAVAALVFGILLSGDSAGVREFRDSLFGFYVVWVRRLFEDDEDRPAQTYSDFLFEPNNVYTKTLSILLPVSLSLAGLVVGTMLAHFGGALAFVVEALIERLTTLPLEIKYPLTEIFSLAVLPVSFLSPLIALVIYRWLRRRAINYSGVTRVPVVKYAFKYYAQAAAFAVLVTAVYMFLTHESIRLAYSRGTVLIAVLLTTILAMVTFVIYRVESVYLRVIAAVHGTRSRNFWINSGKILAAVPQPQDPKGFVFLHTQSDTYSIASLLLVLCRLKQMGWQLVIMDDWPVKFERLKQKHLDRFTRVNLGSQRALNFDWHIDWKAQKVEAAGMNFYHPLWEGLSRHFGRYTIDLEPESEAESIFRQLLQVADATLLTCFRIHNTVAGHGRPVRIIGSSAQFAPNAIINIFCREIGHKRDMHFCWVQQGYQTYYADKQKLSKRISLQNMTRKWPYSNPYLPHTDDFEAWIKRGQDTTAILAEAEQWAATSRATDTSKMRPIALQAFERISAHKAQGKSVVCVLGKMVFDLSTPYERGPAHNGMFDWLNHTVETARKAPDVLYVIKPHPYEARTEIAGRVEQYFTDMIETSVPENVIILGHDWFNLFTLFPLIDLGVMWNGTSGLELGLREIPVLLCSEWGPIDYPVGFPIAKDRAEYERMITNPKSVQIPPNYKERCALLLKYTSTDEVMVPYDYAARPLTNEPFGPPYWYMDQVKRFLREGDPHIDYACSKVL